ncbi:MAG TPA: lytic transglycosylase domain-containing protein [Longimicrobiales bacterium]|nr:lytic transglycosylase domain-containing protein [Longimicrobiales bacterium]
MSVRPDGNIDLARRTWVSPPPSHGPDKVAHLLFQWETRHLSPLMRRVVMSWQNSRRLVSLLTLGLAMFMLGAAVASEPTLEQARLTLERRVRGAESAVKARQGELELARLELARLTHIVEHSKRYRIPADLAGAIYDIAVSEGVDPALAFSLVRVESDFTRTAVSSAGAVGLTQVMPETAFWLQPGLQYADLFEQDVNLRLGFRYLRLMLKQYDGDLQLALLAYNRGPGRVDEILSGGGNPSNGYDRLVRNGARPAMD